jgi:hypothetical protein
MYTVSERQLADTCTAGATMVSSISVSGGIAQQAIGGRRAFVAEPPLRVHYCG